MIRRTQIAAAFVAFCISALSQNKTESETLVADRHIPWLEEDARWIITPGEKAAFQSLKTDEERDIFVDQFWLRRDPTPDTIENEFEEEHYRRIVYANEHFSAAKPGWESDRGHIYIAYGPPDSITSQTKEGIQIQTWSYRYIEGAGEHIAFVFEKIDDRSDWAVTNPLPTLPKAPDLPLGLSRSPQVRFKELEEVVDHKIRYSQLPFHAESRFFKTTRATTLTEIRIKVSRQSVSMKEDGLHKSGLINVYGQVIALTGRIVGQFEDTQSVTDGDVPASDLLSRNTVPLRLGRYQLRIAVFDVNGRQLSSQIQELRVPSYEDLVTER